MFCPYRKGIPPHVEMPRDARRDIHSADPELAAHKTAESINNTRPNKPFNISSAIVHNPHSNSVAPHLSNRAIPHHAAIVSGDEESGRHTVECFSPGPAAFVSSLPVPAPGSPAAHVAITASVPQCLCRTVSTSHAQLFAHTCRVANAAVLPTSQGVITNHQSGGRRSAGGRRRTVRAVGGGRMAAVRRRRITTGS